MAFSWSTLIAGGVAGMMIHAWASDPKNVERAQAKGDETLESAKEFGEGALEIIREQESELEAGAWSAADDAEMRVRQEAAAQFGTLEGRPAAFKKRFRKVLDNRVEQARNQAWATRGGLRELKPGMLFDPDTGVVVEVPEGARNWKRTMQRLPKMHTVDTSTVEGEE